MKRFLIKNEILHACFFLQNFATNSHPCLWNSLLTLDIDTMQGPPPSRGVPSAISSLNAFAQNNAPEMNQLLDSEANAAADAIRNITSELMSR